MEGGDPTEAPESNFVIQIDTLHLGRTRSSVSILLGHFHGQRSTLFKCTTIMVKFCSSGESQIVIAAMLPKDTNFCIVHLLCAIGFSHCHKDFIFLLRFNFSSRFVSSLRSVPLIVLR